jgi:ankyrin repeat protein
VNEVFGDSAVTQEIWKIPSALHAANGANKLDVVNFLIRKEADIEALSPDGMTPLWFSLRLQHYEVTRALIRAGANFEAMGRDGFCPLNFACNSCDAEMVRAS